MDPRDISERSRGVALALAAVIGPFGGHRFYVGKIGTGILMACTIGGFGIWWIYDLIMVATGSFRDVDGKRVWRWAEPGSLDVRGELGSAQLDTVLAELDALRSEVAEVAERVDFMERLVARTTLREGLPSGSEAPERSARG